jgi:hypothetical protein
LGIGDWAQSPIPNPQSPIPNPQRKNTFFKKREMLILVMELIKLKNKNKK